MNSPFNMPDEYVQGFFKAGQSLLPLRKIEPVQDIIGSIMKEARETLGRAKEIQC